MTGKTIKENLSNEEKVEEIDFEETEIEKANVKEIEAEKITVEKIVENKSSPKGNPLRVYRNEGEKLFLIDNAGNGIKIPTPEQYKNVKKGDIIYL